MNAYRISAGKPEGKRPFVRPRRYIGFNRVLRRIFGPKRNEVTGSWRKLLMRSFIICTLLQV
jgi:hypothetical protein